MEQQKKYEYLNDIETLFKIIPQKKNRCIIFNIKTSGIIYEKDHMMELSAVEVENFKLTSKMVHIYIQPRVFLSKNIQKLNNIKYYDYKNYWEYYNQSTKKQLKNFLDFIGNESYLITHIASSNIYFLEKELKKWDLPTISKERFRSTFEMSNEIFKLKKIKNPNYIKLEDFCYFFGIYGNYNESHCLNSLFECIMTSRLLICLYKEYNNYKENKYLKYNTKIVEIPNKNDENRQKNENSNEKQKNQTNDTKNENISEEYKIQNQIKSDEKNGKEYNEIIKINDFAEKNQKIQNIHKDKINKIIKGTNIKMKDIQDKNKNQIKKSVSFKNIEDINFEENEKAISYISSCFDNKNIYYGYGGFILNNNQKYIVKGIGKDDIYSKIENIGGEIVACQKIIDMAISLKIKFIVIYHSYIGIEKWANNDWELKNDGTIKFYEFINDAKNKIKINFINVTTEDNGIIEAKNIALDTLEKKKYSNI